MDGGGDSDGDGDIDGDGDGDGDGGDDDDDDEVDVEGGVFFSEARLQQGISKELAGKELPGGAGGREAGFLVVLRF